MWKLGWPKAKALSRSVAVRRLARTAAAEVVPDIDAFIRGRLAEVIERRGRRVPTWAWTNLLAHGERAAIEADSHARPAQADVWRQARSYLSAEVLGALGPDGDLGHLQDEVLIPLELRLSSDPATAHWRPARWVHEVQTALLPLAAPAPAAHTPLEQGPAHPAGHRS